MDAPWMEYSKAQCIKEAQKFRKEAQSIQYRGLSRALLKHTCIHMLQKGESQLFIMLGNKYNTFLNSRQQNILDFLIDFSY